MGTRDSRGFKKSTCVCERKETVILCAYIEKERGLSGEGGDKLDTTPAPIHEVSK